MSTRINHHLLFYTTFRTGVRDTSMARCSRAVDHRASHPYGSWVSEIRKMLACGLSSRHKYDHDWSILHLWPLCSETGSIAFNPELRRNIASQVNDFAKAVVNLFLFSNQVPLLILKLAYILLTRRRWSKLTLRCGGMPQLKKTPHN